MSTDYSNLQNVANYFNQIQNSLPVGTYTGFGSGQTNSGQNTGIYLTGQGGTVALNTSQAQQQGFINRNGDTTIPNTVYSNASLFDTFKQVTSGNLVSVGNSLGQLSGYVNTLAGQTQQGLNLLSGQVQQLGTSVTQASQAANAAQQAANNTKSTTGSSIGNFLAGIGTTGIIVGGVILYLVLKKR